MKKDSIQIGKTYFAKVSGKLVRVKVNGISERSDYKGRTITRYDCTNTNTEREIMVKSAARFRGEAPLKLSGRMVPGDDGGMTND